jgi:hypothetical protein
MSDSLELGGALLLAPLAIPVLAAAGVVVGAAFLARGALRLANALPTPREFHDRLSSRVYLRSSELLAAAAARSTDLSSPVSSGQRAIAKASACLEQLRTEPIIAAIAEHHSDADLKRAEALLEQASRRQAVGGFEAAEGFGERARVLLAQVAERTLTTYAGAYAHTQANGISAGLDQLGYTVERAADQHGIALWGTRRDEVTHEELEIAAFVDASGTGGMVKMAGFEGVACHLELAGLVTAARSTGLVIPAARYFHGRRGGGVLVQRATARAARTGETKAKALLREAGEATGPGSLHLPVGRSEPDGRKGMDEDVLRASFIQSTLRLPGGSS